MDTGIKKTIITIVAAILPLFASAQAVPSVALTDASGKTVQTQSLIDGKTPFVISMWMTTCKPCIEELGTLTDELTDWEENFPLRIYAVSVDDSRSYRRAVAMAQGSGWDGITPLFDINGDLRRALNVTSVPRVFLYDKDGNLYYTHIGYRPGDELELLEKVRNCHSSK